MSRYRKGRILTSAISLIAVCALAVLWGVETSKRPVPAPLFEAKVSAARLMHEAMALIKDERLRRGIAIDRVTDPNETGMIGAEYTDLTSTLGSLTSKRTSTNPNFAGVIVEMLDRAGARPGNHVAVSLSGSFPALNTAALAAVKVLRLQPVIISSVGASTFGANHPGLTWLDMETLLNERGLFPYASQAASLGGIVETRGGLGEQGIAMGLIAVERNGIPYLDEGGPLTLERDIERRLSIYAIALGGRKPAAFVNIGGSLTSLGNCPKDPSLPAGLLLGLPISKCRDRGIILRMTEKGIPAIHLLNIKRIAVQYGLPIDPIPLPAIPSGRVMLQERYSIPLALSGVILLSLVLLMKGTIERLLRRH